jgi:uncharacterized protein (TIGR02001 family)
MRLICVVALLTAIAASSLTVRADEAPPAHATTPAPPQVEAPPSEKEWTVTGSFDLWSEYIFRGVDLSGNDIMLNPSASVSWKGFTGYYWGAFNDSDAGNNRWYEETDFGIEYGHSFFDNKLTLAGGALWYLYLDGVSGKDTVELYGKATVNVLLSPYVSLYYDIDEFHGGYLSFGVSHSFDIGGPLGLPEPMALSIDPSAQLSVDLGYNSRGSGSNVQLNDLLVGIKVPWQITENIQVHACYYVSIAMDSLNDIGQGNESIGNVGVTFTY